MLRLEVQERGKGKAGKQSAEEVVEGHKEGICPLFAEVELERWMLLGVLGER